MGHVQTAGRHFRRQRHASRACLLLGRQLDFFSESPRLFPRFFGGSLDRRLGAASPDPRGPKGRLADFVGRRFLRISILHLKPYFFVWHLARPVQHPPPLRSMKVLALVPCTAELLAIAAYSVRPENLQHVRT